MKLGVQTGQLRGVKPVVGRCRVLSVVMVGDDSARRIYKENDE